MILRVDRDGAEFFVDTITGLSGISISGLARLCEISHQALSKLLLRLEELIARRTKAATKSPSESLEPNSSKAQDPATKSPQKATTKNTQKPLKANQGKAKKATTKSPSEKARMGRPVMTEDDLAESLLELLDGEIYMDLGSEYVGFKVLTERAVSKIIEYYALDAEPTRKQAKQALRQFNQRGVRNWIYEIVDWHPELAPAAPPKPLTRAEKLGIAPRYLDVKFDRHLVFNLLTDPKITAPMYRLYLCFLDAEIAEEQPDIPTLCDRARVAQKGLHNLIDRMDEFNLVPDWFELDGSTQGVEDRIRDRLQAELGGQTEVNTLHGRIDLVTATHLIEIKRIDNWQKGFGQIFSKTAAYPKHAKRLHLFGSSERNLRNIAACCKEFEIDVTFELVQEMELVA
jgi:hypothetical protein